MATLNRFLICDSVSATGKRISLTKPLTDSASDDTVYLSEALNVDTTQLNKCDYVAISVPNANNTAHEVIACLKTDYDKDTFTMSSCTRGVIGYGSTISSDSNLIAKHEAGAEISIPVLVQDHVARQEVFDGERATNANSFQIGDGTATEQLFKANQGLANDSAFGFDASGDPIIYLSDGSSFVPGAGAGAISGGDGIDVTASVISVDLATDPGLEMSSNKLRAKVKTSGGITRDGDGLSVNTSDFVATLVSDTAYDESTWNGVTNVAPSKNAVRDEIESVKSSIPGSFSVASGTTEFAAADTERSSTSTSYVKVKEIEVSAGGTYTVDFDLKLDVGGTGAVGYGRIYKNGVAFGAEQVDNNSATYATKSADLAFSSGDLVQLYYKASAGTVYVRNFKLKGSVIPVVTVNTD